MISQTNNEDITGKIEDVVSEKINQLDIITRDVVEQVVQEAIQGGGSGGTSDTAKRLEDNGCSVEFSTEKGVLNINGSEDRTALLLKYNNSMQAGFIYLKSDDNEICNIGSWNSMILSNEYNINTKQKTTELHGNNIKLEGNATISGDLTVKGKIYSDTEDSNIKVKYQIVGDEDIFDTGNVVRLTSGEAEFYEITDDSLFPAGYKSSLLQYPYKYRIQKDSDTGDDYILLRIDHNNKYTYDLTNYVVSSNFDKETTTEIRPRDTPLLAVNGVKMTSLKELYKSYNILINIDFGNDFDTRDITDMYGMFWGCGNVININVSNFNTTITTNMGRMFQDCGQLKSLDVSNFDTPNLTNMEFMFSSCKQLTVLDVSKFTTSNISSLYYTFHNCSALSTLDLSKLNFSNITNMSEAFSSCRNLTTLILPNTPNSLVGGLYNTFGALKLLKTLDLSGFDILNGSDMRYMFMDSDKLETLTLSNFDVSKAITEGIFQYCASLQTVVIKNEYAEGIRDLLPTELNTETTDSPEAGLTTFSRSQSHTITHLTNIPENAEIGTFCETNGGIFDGYIKTTSTDCICKVVQSNTLNSKIVGIICDKNKFASHGDVLVKVVPGTYNLGDILCPDITGKARVATETEKQFMMINAIPRPKITAFTEDQSLVACFIV